MVETSTRHKPIPLVLADSANQCAAEQRSQNKSAVNSAHPAPFVFFFLGTRTREPFFRHSTSGPVSDLHDHFQHQ